MSSTAERLLPLVNLLDNANHIASATLEQLQQQTFHHPVLTSYISTETVDETDSDTDDGVDEEDEQVRVKPPTETGVDAHLSRLDGLLDSLGLKAKQINTQLHLQAPRVEALRQKLAHDIKRFH